MRLEGRILRRPWPGGWECCRLVRDGGRRGDRREAIPEFAGRHRHADRGVSRLVPADSPEGAQPGDEGDIVVKALEANACLDVMYWVQHWHLGESHESYP